MAKKFFIEITDPQTNDTHISEFNQGKVFNSIEACQTFLDDNFIVYNKNNLLVHYWEMDQVSNGDDKNKISYLGTSGRQAIELQKGINIYLPYESGDQVSVSVSNWIIRVDSGPTISDKLKNKHIVLKDNKALVNWTDKMVNDLRPEAVLRLYALRGQYPVLENQEDNNNTIHSLDNLQVSWEAQREFTEHRFFMEGKKGVETFETKPNNNQDWFVKSLLIWKKSKTRISVTGMLYRNFVKNITILSAINGKPVKSIKKGTFKNCVNLKSIVIPNSIASVGKEAFYGCTGVTNIKVSNSVTYIEKETFYNCSGLKNINIPNSVTSIKWGAFKGCTGLTNVNIPNSVISIEWGAFEGCTGLTNVNIPNSVTSIENSTFKGCSGLKNINIPDSITSIKWEAFKGCTELTKVNIPNSITSIENSAFKGCTGLTNVNIPNSVKSIGAWAFYNCTGLTNIIIPESITHVEDWVFGNCANLNSVVLPNSLTSIGWGAFKDCTGLTKVVIPKSVTSIGWGAFKDCTGLTKVVIPKSIAFVGHEAFDSCTELKNIVVKATTPPCLIEFAFNNSVHDRKIFVPKESLDNYKQVWSDCKDDIYPIE